LIFRLADFFFFGYESWKQKHIITVM